MSIPMLFRFSLYGFLKNQQYYEPFFILALREKGLSYATIGILYGFRELSKWVMEVPSGVAADLYGRRRSMVLCFVAYIVSFAIFGTSSELWQLFAAMFFFAVGEAFRTGTHKAMILDWLRLQGREHEKTRTYGFTRSWSKIGSAVSALVAAAVVFYRGQYSDIFLFAIIPYVLGIVNFLGYPAQLDGRPEKTPSFRTMLSHLAAALRQAIRNSRLRRILFEAMIYEGTFKVTKDYLQPVLKQIAFSLPVLAALEGEKRTAVIVGCVYFAMHLLSGIASTKSHAFAERSGGESRAARRLWIITLLISVPVAAALWFEVFWLAAGGFVALALLQNLWRPINITRVDNETDAKMGATMFSIESQAKALGAMVMAPLIGLGVDRLSAAPEQPALWVAGTVGAAVILVGALLPSMSPSLIEQKATGRQTAEGTD